MHWNSTTTKHHHHVYHHHQTPPPCVPPHSASCNRPMRASSVVICTGWSCDATSLVGLLAIPVYFVTMICLRLCFDYHHHHIAITTTIYKAISTTTTTTTFITTTTTWNYHHTVQVEYLHRWLQGKHHQHKLQQVMTTMCASRVFASVDGRKTTTSASCRRSALAHVGMESSNNMQLQPPTPPLTRSRPARAPLERLMQRSIN